MRRSDWQAVLEKAECLCTPEEVAAAYRDMASGIRDDLADRNPLVVAVMKGGMVTASRLLEHLDFPYEVDYLHATRYRSGTRGHDVQWYAEPRISLAGRHVLIVDDILDEGATLAAIVERCRAEGAANVSVAVLVRKHHDRCVPGLAADYVGLDVDDRYVFGCGMDYHEQFRGLPAIYAVADEEGDN